MIPSNVHHNYRMKSRGSPLDAAPAVKRARNTVRAATRVGQPVHTKKFCQAQLLIEHLSKISLNKCSFLTKIITSSVRGCPQIMSSGTKG